MQAFSMRHNGLPILLAALWLSVVGCEAPTSPTPPSSPGSSSAASRAPSTDDVETDGDVERTVAEVGVGKKGRNYGGGIISEPIRALHRTEQRLQLTQVTQALQMYKATNGHLPKSHEIFWKDIIEANSMQLPELPEGERYVYDPEKGELMVERPKP